FNAGRLCEEQSEALGRVVTKQSRDSPLWVTQYFSAHGLEIASSPARALANRASRNDAFYDSAFLGV
ncbi:MAG: hypothetical protein IAE95_12405, partial [Chitinophagaceae bacterium]|nr:hypothetical protein [Chitinophagaceae bacterium]